MAMIQFATLVTATMLAAAAAVALDWVLLRAAFVLMRPAAAASRRSFESAGGQRLGVRTGLVRGTAQMARAFAPLERRNDQEHQGKHRRA